MTKDSRIVDPRVRSYIEPVRILWSDNVETPDVLLQSRFGQVPEGRFYEGSGCLLEIDDTKKGSAVLLDFGRELHGGVQIGCGGRSSRGMKIRLRFGESASEAMSELGEKGACNDHAIRDGIVDVPWLGSREFGMTGFRFVRIDLVTKGRLSLDFVRAVSLMRPMKRRGNFRCSDSRLNEIWSTAVRTVHLCCQEYLWDGIKRDRLVWQGDMQPEVESILSVFGADPVITESLDYMIATTPSDGWMNNHPPYTIWWVRCLFDYWFASGNTEYLSRHHAYFVKTVEHLLAHIGPDGHHTMPGGFLDWPSNHNKPAIDAGMQALLVSGLDCAEKLSTVLGEVKLAKACRNGIKKLRECVPDPAGSKQAAALLALSGLRKPKEMFRDVLGKGGVKGVSTFYGYYMLEAMSSAGENEYAVQIVRDYWGAMLDMGATSFWEDFNVDWAENSYRIDELPVAGKKDIHGDFGEFCYCGFRHSLCHGWSSGPATWLIRHVLGIRIMEPGAKVVEVKPCLGPLEWAEGALAVPGGSVRVKARRLKNGSVDVKVTAPENVVIIQPARK